MALRRSPVKGPPSASGRLTRRVRRRIYRIDSWSVLRISLIFYSVALLGFTIGVLFLYPFAAWFGIVDNIERFIGTTGLTVRLGIAEVLRTTFVFGIVSAIWWTTFNVVAAFIYNIASDLIGGVEIVTLERDQ